MARVWKGWASKRGLCRDTTPIAAEHPEFTPAVGQFRGASAFARVGDGWFVGFNQGEFGAALYWFSLDGQRNYKISDHQVLQFVRVWDGICAIEGLAHMTINEDHSFVSRVRISNRDGAFSRFVACPVNQGRLQ